MTRVSKDDSKWPVFAPNDITINRERRDDYIDPPGFFDGCVWPIYTKREKKALQDSSVNG